MSRCGSQRGFTLVEALVTLLVFSFVSLAIGQAMRVGFIFDGEFRTLEEANFQYQQGMRLLLEGDPPGTANPHPGLLEASDVHLRPGGCGGPGKPCSPGGGAASHNRMHYLIASTSQVFEVYIANGELLRRQVVPSLSPTTPKVLAGGSPLGVKFVLNTLSGNPATAFGTLLAAGDTRAIRLPMSMYVDSNQNNARDTAERLIALNPTVFVRNAR